MAAVLASCSLFFPHSSIPFTHTLSLSNQSCWIKHPYFFPVLETGVLSPGIFLRHCWKDLHLSRSSLCTPHPPLPPTTEILMAPTGLQKLSHILLSGCKSKGRWKKSAEKNSSYSLLKGGLDDLRPRQADSIRIPHWKAVLRLLSQGSQTCFLISGTPDS